MWQCDWSTLTLVVLKIETRKINWKENKNEKDVVTTKRFELETIKDLSCAIKSPSFTKERMETGIFRFSSHFSKIWKGGERYKVKRIGERADSWPTPTLILKDRRKIIPEISGFSTY